MLYMQQTLRAQDSIPFFRRISSEYRRPQFEQQDSPASDTLPELDRSVSSPCHSSLLTADASEMDYGHDTVTIVEAIEMRAQGPEPYPGGSPMSDMDAMTSEMLRQGKDVTTPLVQASPTDAYVSTNHVCMISMLTVTTAFPSGDSRQWPALSVGRLS